jgi:hypothetical protein
MRIALALAICACGKSAPTPAPVPMDDVAYDFPYDDILRAYMLGVVQGLAEWDGDCTKQLERMQEDDVLYRDIQRGKARVPAALVAEVHTKMVVSIDNELTYWKETRSHLEATVSEIEQKCPRPDVVAELNKIFAVVKSP